MCKCCIKTRVIINLVGLFALSAMEYHEGMKRIVVQGHPVLRQKAEPVPRELFNTEELKRIIAHLSAALRETENGVAIAAPQIGIPYRIFVVAGFVIAGNPRNLEDPDIPFINPTLTRKSIRTAWIDEGCLSVPHCYGKAKRSLKASVSAYDIQGKKFERGGTNLLAQIFQHEIDHLNGILFIDHAREVEKSKPA